MILPDSCNSMSMAQLRFVQSIHEPADQRNPDTLVRCFLTLAQRCRGRFLGRERLRFLRSDPFYYYLIARTKYYDQVFLKAISDGFAKIVNIGCGSDTRAFRFADLLRSNEVRVLECDQPEAIHAKRCAAKRRWRDEHVAYLPIDLNDTDWPDLTRALRQPRFGRALVLMEGVSPYVNASNFGFFLEKLCSQLSAGSLIAYDFKAAGKDDQFGISERARNPFRLPAVRDDVVRYHRERGLRVEWFESSADLSVRLIPALVKQGIALFREDGLVRVEVAQ